MSFNNSNSNDNPNGFGFVGGTGPTGAGVRQSGEQWNNDPTSTTTTTRDQQFSGNGKETDIGTQGTLWDPKQGGDFGKPQSSLRNQYSDNSNDPTAGGPLSTGAVLDTHRSADHLGGDFGKPQSGLHNKISDSSNDFNPSGGDRFSTGALDDTTRDVDQRGGDFGKPQSTLRNQDSSDFDPTSTSGGRFSTGANVDARRDADQQRGDFGTPKSILRNQHSDNSNDFDPTSDSRSSTGAQAGRDAGRDADQQFEARRPIATNTSTSETGATDDHFSERRGHENQQSTGSDGRKPTVGDRLKGSLEKAAGKVAGNPVMVERGEERKAGNNNGASGAF